MGLWQPKSTRCNRRRRKWLFRVGGAIALLGIFCLLIFGPLQVVFDQAFLVEHLQRFRCCTAALFVLAHVLATLFGIPGTVLAVTGGALFGLFWGTLWSVLGATLGAIGAFWVARYLLHGWAQRRFWKHPVLARLNRAATNNAWQCVLAIRFAPISPFNLVNFLFGLTAINLMPYAIGTLIGIIPGTLAYTWLGVAGMEAFHGGDRLSLFLALGSLCLLSLIPYFSVRRQ